MPASSASKFEWAPAHQQFWLAFTPWLASGFQHGFGNAALTAAELTKSFPESQIVLELKQTHSNDVLNCQSIADLQNWRKSLESGKTPSADAVVLCRKTSLNRQLIAIKTADYIPLIIQAGDQFALVHAGWRGLAGKIITKTLQLMLASSNIPHVEVVIGPCAGADQYEVGSEVIEQIGPTSVYQSSTNGKQLLNLIETASKEIRNSIPDCKIYNTGICTIRNTEFNSYRRQGVDAGRNLSFIVL